MDFLAFSRAVNAMAGWLAEKIRRNAGEWGLASCRRGFGGWWDRGSGTRTARGLRKGGLILLLDPLFPLPPCRIFLGLSSSLFAVRGFLVGCAPSLLIPALFCSVQWRIATGAGC